MERVLNEIRFALRSLRRRPGFTAVTALTLALGIGANSAIFTVINGVLLRPLPYNSPEGLVVVWVAPASPDEAPRVMSYPDIADLESGAESLESLVGVSRTSMTLTGMGDPVVINAARLSNGLLATFRLAPLLGRDIRADEFGPRASHVVVIGHGFWHRRFGAADDVVGRSLRLNGVSYEIVGVAPEGFDFPAQAELWYPREIDPEGCGRGCHTWDAVGRVAPDATVASVQAEADAIAANLEEQYPGTNFEKRFLVRSLRDQVVGDVETGLWSLLGAVAAVLLIACANVANLLLARGSGRRGEVAVRAALGASRARLASGLLIEGAVLAALGGAGGVLLAAGGVELLQRLSAGTVPRVETIAIDGTVLLFASALVVAVTLLFGSSPAIHLARLPLASNLKAAGRGADGGRGGPRLRAALSAAEMALSVILLIGAGLLLRTFSQLHAVDLGFETRRVLRFNLSLPESQYETLEQARLFYRTLEQRIEALPGVGSVGSIYGAPLGRYGSSGIVLVEGRPNPEPWEETGAAIRAVSPQYLQTMRIPLLRGRLLEPADDTSGQPVAVVNRVFARENFGADDPIGQRVRVTVDMGFGSPYWTIVGVVGDVRSQSLTWEPRSEIYVSHGQFGPRFMTVAVRTAPRAPTSPLGAIRAEVRRLDPELPLRDVETVAEAVGREVAPTRFFLLVLGLFAALAVLLAAVGLYGVTAYLVARRTREIGVRVALGARRAKIVRMVLADGLQPTMAGLLVGLGIVLAAGRLIEGLLYGVTFRDPWILLSVPLLLTAVAAAATLLPAARASRVDPVEALRSE